MRRLLPFALLTVVVAAFAGCKSTAPKPALATIRYDDADPLKPERDTRAPDTGPLYFGFDEHALSADAQRSLREVARYLQERPDVHLTVEGHCDEVGTSEYNLALGNSRALAAKRYLVALGVDEERVKVLSFGEERPVLFGSDDEARARNRRDELVFFSSEEAQATLDDASSALDVVLAWGPGDRR